MVAANGVDMPEATGGGGDLYDTKPGPGAEAVRDLGVQPLLAGFVQGFASIAVPIWRERRRARCEARELAAAGAAVAPTESLDVPVTAEVYIAPQ